MSYNIDTIKLDLKSKLIIDIEELVLAGLHSSIEGNYQEEIQIHPQKFEKSHKLTIETSLGLVTGELLNAVELSVENVSPPTYTGDETIVDYLVNVAKDSQSHVEFIVVWESGDTIEKIVVKNGEVKKTTL